MRLSARAPLPLLLLGASLAMLVSVQSDPISDTIKGMQSLFDPFTDSEKNPLWNVVINTVNLFSWVLPKSSNGDDLDLWDSLWLDMVPEMLGQKKSNFHGTRKEFRDYALRDESNDECAHMTALQIISRSGYKFKVFEAIADDGYITQITRLINPLADQRQLRYPPVLIEHGGTIDPTAYIIGSSGQHHPEVWPRKAQDGPITSWNRSLAFMLCNNGYDVWLAETRGSSDSNRGHVRERAKASLHSGRYAHKNLTKSEKIASVIRSWNYWGFSQDDIIAHELKSHMDLVQRETGAQQMSVFTFSLSTPTSLSFFSIRPDYAERVHGFVSMAPIVSGEGTTLMTNLIMKTLCPLLPNAIGTLLITDTVLTQPIRDLIVSVSRNKKVRYSLTKLVVAMLMGPSAQYETLLDLNVLGHMLRQLSFKEAKQLCQQMAANKLQKFDYGPVANMMIYNRTEPPVYDLSNLHIHDWIVVSADQDQLSTPQVVRHLIDEVNPKPSAHIVARDYNHLDLIAGFENDRKVNLPILAYFNSRSFIPEPDSGLRNETRYREFEEDRVLDSEASARSFSIESMFNGFDLQNLTKLPAEVMNALHLPPIPGVPLGLGLLPKDSVTVTERKSEPSQAQTQPGKARSNGPVPEFQLSLDPAKLIEQMSLMFQAIMNPQDRPGSNTLSTYPKY